MTSVEIAELTGKSHHNVMRDIRKLIDQGAINASNFGLMNTRTLGQTATHVQARLPNNHDPCHIIVSTKTFNVDVRTLATSMCSMLAYNFRLCDRRLAPTACITNWHPGAVGREDKPDYRRISRSSVHNTRRQEGLRRRVVRVGPAL